MIKVSSRGIDISMLDLACVQTLDKKLKRWKKVESAQLSHYSCSRVPRNQGIKFEWSSKIQLSP